MWSYWPHSKFNKILITTFQQLKAMETDKTLKSFEPLGNEGGVSNRIASWFQAYHMYPVPFPTPPPPFLSPQRR